MSLTKRLLLGLSVSEAAATSGAKSLSVPRFPTHGISNRPLPQTPRAPYAPGTPVHERREL